MAGMAASSADAAATKCTEILIEKIMKEFPYLCCYKSYAADFEKEKKRLKAAVDSVERKIKEAQKRNETQIDPIVKNWVEEANELIQQDTTPKKWSSRYSLAKELERMTQEIPTMMDKAENFSQVAHAAERPGVEFYSPDFKPFKSRDSKFEELLEQLKDGSKCRIGLQAMGGSGKTTMAKAIWKELENSKAFDKVIFIEVPNPVDEKKVRDEIEKKLDLETEDDKKKNLTQAEQIWIRIANTGNVLIILDDVWEELKLERIGIHHGIHNKGRCCVLLTTRYMTICISMRCQKIIELEVLPEKEAVDLFLYHASESGKDCPNKSKLLASKIVNQCGRLPVIVVALAKTFRNRDPNEWEDAFAMIEKDSSLGHENIDEANKFYNSLKISFKLLDQRAQDIILLCSIFPRAYEIPVELLSEITIGLGICKNVDSYYRARSEVLSIKTTLVSSALLLTPREGYIKMHDVIREVARQIGDENIQEGSMDSETKLKKNVKYSSWIINDFSNHFEGNHLEVLLVWVNANGSLEVPETFFEGVKGLRVLLLCSKFEFGRTHALSLPKSIHSLENIQTLSLTNWDLGDISILKNLKKLQALELTNCSIIELPNDVGQLEKLRLLLLVCCSIKRNNPLEVIGRCSNLEVLYYVSNDDSLNSSAKPSKTTVLQEFEIYHIEGSSSKCSFQLDASTKRYFNLTMLKGILSESTVKSLAARAEILELTECEETRWTNLIPDMVHPKENGGMNDLTRLSLKSWPTMQCLICTNGIPSDAALFSNLVDLRLHNMLVRELCQGDFPIDFLKQLEKLNLSHCDKLDGTLFKGKLELSNLKFVALKDCSMTCLFHLSTAQSLRQLENLYIRGCSKLKCLISDDERAEQKVDDHQDPNQKNHHSMFLKLKLLKVQECHELEFILPIFPCKELESINVGGCNELKYIFGQCLKEGGQYQMENEIILPLLQKIKIANGPKFINIYPEFHPPQPSQVQKTWGPMCCFSSKASALNIDEQSVSKGNQPDHTQASKEKHLSRVGGLFTSPSYPFKNLRKMSIKGFSELKSLLTLSIASSLKLMETLKVNGCGMLEHIITDERPNSHDRMNVHSIFPNLQQVCVWSCHNLEYVFPAFYSRDFKHLEKVSIWKADKMKYVFGKCHADQDHNVQSELALPALKELDLDDVPNMVSICTKKYLVKALSLQDMILEDCPQLPINTTVMDLCVDVEKREEDLSKRKEKGKKEFTCLYVTKASKAKSVPSATHGYSPLPFYQIKLRSITISRFSGLTSLFTISMASSLKFLDELKVENCDALEHIMTDENLNNHDYMNDHSVFPNLHHVYVWKCNNLEYVLPAFYSKSSKTLKSVKIWEAKEMKYVFGKCHADQNHNAQSKLDLQALKSILFNDVPNMISICAENYYVEVLYLEYISFERCPQLPQPFIDFLVGGHKKREDLSRRKALSFKEKGKALSNLQELADYSRVIYVGPKNILSFQNLSVLKFAGCKQLKFILFTSTTRSIPELRCLIISNCEELVSIVDDDEDNQQNPLDPHQACFPKLRTIQLEQCKELKCLFSTRLELPGLMILNIEDAPKLVQIFEGKQGAPQVLITKNVLPMLRVIRLVKLPSLHTTYQGIDFQTVKIRLVRDCGNIPSANVSSSELFAFHASLLRQGHIIFEEQYIIYQWATERQREESEEARVRDETISSVPNISTPDLAYSEDASKEAVEKDSTIQKRKSSSLNLTEIEEEGSSQESIGNDSTMPQQTNVSPNFETNTLHNSATLSSGSDMNNLVHYGASSSSHAELTISNIGTSVSTKELCEKKSKVDQEALEEGTNLNKDPRRDEECTDNNFTKETTKKVVLAIPPASTEMTPPLDPLISPSQKPQMATSTTNIEPKSSQPHLSDISITTECPRVEIMTNDETSTNEKEMKFDQKSSSQIFEEHDLMRLFQMLKEGADMEVDLSYVSKLIVDLQDNKEVSNALADLEASLKMGLNEIACSDKSRLRLHNAVNTLSSHCSEDGASSHGLQATIQSLQQEIETVLSSFNQAYTTIDSLSKLEQKEKLMIEQRSQREKDAKTLLYDINTTKNSIAKAQLKEAELKEQISKFQAELRSKEEEIEEYERKLLSLQEQEKNSLSDAIGFTMEFLAMEKERSYMVEDQMKARQQLENMEAKWSSCSSNLKKTMLLLGVHLKQKF